MSKVILGKVLVEQRQTVGTADGDNLPLIGVDNKTGLHLSRQKRLADVSRYKLLKMHWFAYNPMRINVGSIGYADSESKTGIISPDYVVFSCSDQILPEYFLHFIKSDIGQREIARHTGGSVRERLYFRNLAKIEIELPAIEKQRKIVHALNKKKALLNRLFEECRLFDQEIQLLRSAILQEAVQGELTQQDHNDEPASVLLQRIKAEKQYQVKEGKLKKEKALPPIAEAEIPFELPKGWEWCRFGEITTRVDYGTSEKASAVGEIPILRMGNVQEGKVVLANLKYVKKSIKDLPRLLLNKKDLIFNRTNSYELVGKCGIFEGDNNVYTLASYLIRVSVIHNLVSVDFANFYLNSSICRKTQIEPQITQQTGQANFSGSKLKEIAFPLPPLTEQLRIVAKVQQLQQHLSGLETQVQQNQQYTQQLLQAVLKEAFEGKGKEKEYEVNEELTLAAES